MALVHTGHSRKENGMNWRWLFLTPGLAGLLVMSSGLPTAAEPKSHGPQVLLAETYNAVTRVHFMNVAVHKGSPNPNPAKRRFRADVKYWLMDAKYYDQAELSIGNPALVDFVRKLGSKNLPASEPTTLSAMAYEIAKGVLDKYPIINKIEVRLTHFSKGEKVEDESQDNHVVNIVLQRNRAGDEK
jgi:hypothetical protein